MDADNEGAVRIGSRDVTALSKFISFCQFMHTSILLPDAPVRSQPICKFMNPELEESMPNPQRFLSVLEETS